jgi:hypothetical protein
MKTGTGIGLLAAIALCEPAWTGLDNTNQPLRLELELVDGSRIIGTPGINMVPLQTSYAKMDVPLKQILTVRMGEDHETASVNLRNGDKLKGVISLSPITLETVFGKASINIEHIRDLRVMLSGGALPAGLTKGLVLYYSFDRDDGGKVTDKSGKGNHGTVRGAEWVSEGIAGGAMSFDVKKYVDTGCNLSGMDEISVCGWARPSKAARSASVATQFGGPASDNVWGLFAQNDNGNDLVPPHQSAATVLTADGRRPTAVGKRTQIGQWTHLCFTFKRNGQIVLYKDGVSVAQDTVGDSSLNKRDSTAKIGASLGGDAYWGVGLIDEVMIYDRALTETEVQQIFDTQKREQ